VWGRAWAEKKGKKNGSGGDDERYVIPLGVGTNRQPRLRATDAKHETMNLIRCRDTPVCSTRRSSHWKLGRWWSRSTIFGKEEKRKGFEDDGWRPLMAPFDYD
jgi:hypothetical protein